MKKTIHDNYRLEVYPDTYRLRASVFTNHDSMRAFLDEIVRGIKRHVVDVDQVIPKWDTRREECSHCGYEWEVLTAEEAAQERVDGDEHATEGQPVCCGKAVEEFRTERGISLGST